MESKDLPMKERARRWRTLAKYIPSHVIYRVRTGKDWNYIRGGGVVTSCQAQIWRPVSRSRNIILLAFIKNKVEKVQWIFEMASGKAFKLLTHIKFAVFDIFKLKILRFYECLIRKPDPFRTTYKCISMADRKCIPFGNPLGTFLFGGEKLPL